MTNKKHQKYNINCYGGHYKEASICKSRCLRLLCSRKLHASKKKSLKQDFPTAKNCEHPTQLANHKLSNLRAGDVIHPVLWIQGCGFSETRVLYIGGL